MKIFNPYKSDIKKKINKNAGIILMLDFDGTLSPIVKTPKQAKLPENIKQKLKKCLKLFPVIIISGRSLKDIKKKIKLNKIIYAGNHGLEWQINKQLTQVEVSKDSLKSLKVIKYKLSKLISEYPGMLLEDKRLTLAIHYRMIKKSKVKNFIKTVNEIIQPYIQNNLSLIDGNKTYDLRPSLNWTKGHFAEFIIKQMEINYDKKLIPIYVGDDKTDEDVFKKLKNAITIRIGKSQTSKAVYYLKNQNKINNLLQWILEIGKELKIQ